MLQLKVEFYGADDKAGKRNRKRVGLRDVNLCDFVGKGAVTQCFRLDTDKKSQNVYLTVKIQIFTENNDHRVSSGGQAIVNS